MSLFTGRSSSVPRHVAIIMDGNGRWARRRLLPRLEGHRRGAKSVRRAVEFSRSNGIQVLTLYAFSTENWNRPEKEVSGLMRLLSEFLDSELEEIHSNDIRFMTIGDTSRLPRLLMDKIDAAKKHTAANQTMILNIALSYGGRQDILKATRDILRDVQAGRLDQDNITEAVFSEYLYSRQLPDPDLLIRTGGELRISNFLLWQVAYTELYFTETLWPDFNEKTFADAIEAYQVRQRRFGMISEQVEAGSGAH